MMMAQARSAFNNDANVFLAAGQSSDSDPRLAGVTPNVKATVGSTEDTTSVITFGKRRIEVIEENNQTRVRVVKIKDDVFKGHFAGVELGVNSLMTSGLSTSLNEHDQFMALDQGKSLNVGVNFLQYSIALSQRNNFGLVTGAGFIFSNYRLDNSVILQRNELTGKTIGVEVEPRRLEKSKLVTTFINIPLLFELQFPASKNGKGYFLSAGGFMGLKTGSHIKVIYENQKQKSREDLNIRPCQYGLSLRAGCDWLKFFANYNLTPLFEDEMGPEVYPFSMGIVLVSL